VVIGILAQATARLDEYAVPGWARAVRIDEATGS
jgi:hypothetical protein